MARFRKSAKCLSAVRQVPVLVYDECAKRYLVDVWRQVLGSGPRRHLPVPLIRPPSARATAQRIAAAMVLLPEDWAAAARKVQAPRRDAVCGAGLC